MAKNVIQSTILSINGGVSVAPGAQVEVRTPSGLLASLWLDRDGTQPTTNPFYADGNGFFRVYTDAGRVHITAHKDGKTQEWRDVVLPPDLYIGKPTADPAEAITGSLLSGAMLAAGAIVEMGENANGSYWRWESGLQVCVSPLLVPEEYGGFTDRVQAQWTYPAVFHSIPRVLPGRDGSITSPKMVYGVPASLAITTTSATLRLIDAEGRFSPGQQYASVFGLAIGAWK